MSDLTLFTVDNEDEIGTEDLSRSDLTQELRTAPDGAWARDEDWPVLFAHVRDDEGHEATLVVPFDDPREFQDYLEDNNLERELVVSDFDMEILERIEQEIA